MSLDKRIVFNEDGKCNVIIPANLNGQTIEQYADSVLGATPYVIVDKTDIPTDRWFRDAWSFDEQASNFYECINKSKDCQKNHWRTARNKCFDILDKKYSQYLGQNDTVNADLVESKRQLLRDVTNEDLSTKTTITEVKDTWPAILDEDYTIL